MSVLPDAAPGVDPAAWLRQMQDEGVTVWNSVPALMQSTSIKSPSGVSQRSRGQ